MPQIYLHESKKYCFISTQNDIIYFPNLNKCDIKSEIRSLLLSLLFFITSSCISQATLFTCLVLITFWRSSLCSGLVFYWCTFNSAVRENPVKTLPDVTWSEPSKGFPTHSEYNRRIYNGLKDLTWFTRHLFALLLDLLPFAPLLTLFQLHWLFCCF